MNSVCAKCLKPTLPSAARRNVNTACEAQPDCTNMQFDSDAHKGTSVRCEKSAEFSAQPIKRECSTHRTNGSEIHSTSQTTILLQVQGLPPASAVIKSHTRSTLLRETEPRRIRRQISIQRAPKRYLCNICRRVFSHFYRAQRHVAQHLGVRPHKCHVCHKGFNLRASLKQHLSQHSYSQTVGAGNEIPDEAMTTLSKMEPAFMQLKDVSVSPQSGRNCSSPSTNSTLSAVDMNTEHHAQIKHFLTKSSSKGAQVPLSISNSNPTFDRAPPPTHSPTRQLQPPEILPKTGGKLGRRPRQRSQPAGVFGVRSIKMTASASREKSDTPREPRKHRKCDLCPCTFYKDSEFKKHMKEHEASKTFPCKDCDLSYATSAELNRHYGSEHPGPRPFKCPDCDQTFVQKTHLHNHARRHTGEKEFVCPTCSKGFSRKAHQIEHMDLHKKDKQHACDKCPEKFSQLAGLRGHMKRAHHEKESLRCPKCPTSLKTKYGRYVHIISRHSEDVATDFSEHSGGATHTGVEADQQGHSDNTVISAYPVMMLSSYRFVVGNIAEYELTSPPSVKIA